MIVYCLEKASHLYQTHLKTFPDSDKISKMSTQEATSNNKVGDDPIVVNSENINDNPPSNEVYDKLEESDKNKKKCDNCDKLFDKSYVKKHIKNHCPVVKKTVGNEKSENLHTDTVDVVDNGVDNEDKEEEILGVISELSSQESVITAAAKVLDEVLMVATTEETSTETDTDHNGENECKECDNKEDEIQALKLERLKDVNEEGDKLRNIIKEKDIELVEKDTKIEEKSATILGLINKMRNHGKEKQTMVKKIKEIERLKNLLSNKDKEINQLMVAVNTKDFVIKMKEAKEKEESTKEISKEITNESPVVKCKKENCNFEAQNLNVMNLHIENDHKCSVVECTNCGEKFRFKNQLKLHKKQVHEETQFACFVCNKKFKSYKDLQKHIQKRCKTGNTSQTKTSSVTPPPPNKQTTNPSTITQQYHDSHTSVESRYQCPKCNKVVNNQSSLIQHINQDHANIDKCETCNKECSSKEDLVKHIAQYHTQRTIERFICSRCNVELHGISNKESHRCRSPQWTCHFCKVELYSHEAKKNHICPNHQFKTMEQQSKVLQRKNIECRWGQGCSRWAQNRCWFKHSELVNSLPHRAQVGQQGNRAHNRSHISNVERPQLWCKFQERCHNKRACRFKHFDQDFIQEQQVIHIQ